MTITWYGQSCFKVQTKDTTIVTDPFDKSIGLKPYAGGADVVTVSHSHYDHNNVGALRGTPLVINTPGEYEIKNIFINGLASFHDKKSGAERGLNTIYVFEAEDMRVCHLGDLGEALSDKAIDNLGQIDILMIPVGGVYTIDAKEASELIDRLEPSIVLPMHYKIAAINIKFDPLDKFLSTRGIKSKETMDHLTIKKKELVAEEGKVIVLSPAH